MAFDPAQTLNPGDQPTGEAVKARRQAMQELNPKIPASVTVTPSTEPSAQPATPKAKARSIPAPGPYGTQGKEKRMDVSDMVRPLGSLKKGTPSVPKTGIYKLHEGEKVTPEKDNPDSKKGDHMATPYDMITAGSKKPKKEIKEMVHSKSHNGKHIVTHKHHSPTHHPDETHVFEDMQGVHDHMDAHDAGTDGAAPITAAPSPMPEPAAPNAAAGAAPAAPAM